MRMYEKLLVRAQNNAPIHVGLVGCGQMGSGLVHVTHKMTGMETVAIADIDVERSLNTLRSLGVADDDICITTKPGEAEDALRTGRYLVTDDALLLTHLESLH
ncbi:MAG: hypothetical protein E4H27_04255, partial [Anaerolineales bacterium]